MAATEKKHMAPLFWPQDRIFTLREIALDKSEPDDVFEKSQRISWLREFAVNAPSWLEAEETRRALLSTAQRAHAQVTAAMAELEGLLNALIEAKAPAPRDGVLDKFASQVASAKGVEVLPADPAKLDPERRPELVREVPASPEQKLPSEVLRDEALGKPADAPVERSFGEKLDKMRPDAMRRSLGPHTAPPVKLNESVLEYRARVADRLGMTEEERATYLARFEAEADDELDDERTIEANPDDVPPPDEDGAASAPPTQKVKGMAKTRYGSPSSATTVAVKRKDGTVMHRAPRTSYKMELAGLAKAHGEDLADYVANEIIEEKVNVAKIRDVMHTFKGTYASRNEAAAAMAEAKGLQALHESGEDLLATHADHVLEHEDGRCSVWASK